MLKYITRGNVNPSGKQKMYYASTVNDLGGISDTARHILNDYDMAIYYEEDGDTTGTPDSELLNMNCIILLLTEETLRTHNDAIERILPLALEKHIPLLPIGITPEVGPLIGQFCKQNNLPSLDVLFPNKKDETKLPFRQRLKDWMSKFMTGTEEHQRILDNFHTRVFISYRKKDRKMLRMLLDHIYNKAGYHESLIWFDEYLTAGEDYNIEIQNMIDSSDLFIFLYTKNMLEPDNYAIREELSRAVRNKMPILLVNTLDSYFYLPITGYEKLYTINVIPDLLGIIPMDFSGVGSFLAKFLPTPAYSNKAEELEHIYLLGMAYYLGIGALKDKDYGLKLIRYAADKGLIEAMERMVTILIEEYGKYRSAIEYQKRITYYYSQKAKSELPSDLEMYLVKMEVLGDYYYMVGDQDNCENVFRTIIKVLKTVINLTEHKNLLIKATIACTRLGDIADNKMRNEQSAEKKVEYSDEAVDWYSTGEEYALSYRKYEDSLMSRRMIYTPLIRIAEVDRYINNTPPEEKINSYMYILKLIQDADTKYPCYDTRADLYECHKMLMILFNTVGKPAEALYNGQKMLDYARQGYLESKIEPRMRIYIEALESFAALQHLYGQNREALLNYDLASQTRRKHLELTGNYPESAERLINDYICIFDLCIEEGRIEEARGTLKSAQSIANYFGLATRPDILNAINRRSKI